MQANGVIRRNTLSEEKVEEKKEEQLNRSALV